jgi:hypothetical protein
MSAVAGHVGHLDLAIVDGQYVVRLRNSVTRRGNEVVRSYGSGENSTGTAWALELGTHTVSAGLSAVDLPLSTTVTFSSRPRPLPTTARIAPPWE